MHKLALNTQYNANTTMISNTFIDDYMPQANGEFVKIYLYLLRSVFNRRSDISISSMADEFNQTEADVMRALKYWNKTGAIIMSFDGPGNALSGITFCDLAEQKHPHLQQEPVSVNRSSEVTPIMNTSNIASVSDYQDSNVKSGNNTIDYITYSSSHNSEEAGNANITPITVETRSTVKAKKTYSPEQLKELSSQEDFSLLLYAVGAYLGGTLSPTEASTIAYFYDTLQFPTDLIEYLIEYCVSKDHKSMRYIEKVAIAWAEAGIRTIKEAKREINNHSETTYSVMNAFGIANRELGQREREYIKKWSETYGFSLDLILEACNRTLKATHQPSFEYADSILTKWKNSGVKTFSDVAKADAEYEQTRATKKSSAASGKNTNRFNNFHQRDTDIDSLESSLISNNG